MEQQKASLIGCKAGLAESCSHIASVLFYLEAWTKVNRRLSCAQIKCPWILILKCANEEFSLIKLFCSIFLKFEWEIMFLYVLPRLFYRHYALERTVLSPEFLLHDGVK